MTPELAFGLELAYRAGRTTLPWFGVRLDAEHKQDESPVTEADRAAERMIRSELAQRYPEDAILGEEEGESGSGDRRWVIDPIDGTRSFISGVPLFATLLALEVGGSPTLGIAYFPALDWMVYAERGTGAFEGGRTAHVSRISRLDQASLCTSGIGGLVKQNRLDAVASLSRQAAIARTWCDAYGHILVATGRADAMIDAAVARYDISAVSLIVSEAGGRFTDLGGSSVLGSSALSSNGLLHDLILHELSS